MTLDRYSNIASANAEDTWASIFVFILERVVKIRASYHRATKIPFYYQNHEGTSAKICNRGHWYHIAKATYEEQKVQQARLDEDEHDLLRKCLAPIFFQDRTNRAAIAPVYVEFRTL